MKSPVTFRFKHREDEGWPLYSNWTGRASSHDAKMRYALPLYRSRLFSPSLTQYSLYMRIYSSQTLDNNDQLLLCKLLRGTTLVNSVPFFLRLLVRDVICQRGNSLSSLYQPMRPEDSKCCAGLRCAHCRAGGLVGRRWACFAPKSPKKLDSTSATLPALPLLADLLLRLGETGQREEVGRAPGIAGWHFLG